MMSSTFSIRFSTNSSVAHAMSSFIREKPLNWFRVSKKMWFLFSKKGAGTFSKDNASFMEKHQVIFYFFFFIIAPLKHFVESSLLSSFFENHRSQLNSQRPTIHCSIGKKSSFSPHFIAPILSKKSRISSPLLVYSK